DSVALLAASVATGAYRQLPGQDFHLQETPRLLTARSKTWAKPQMGRGDQFDNSAIDLYAETARRGGRSTRRRAVLRAAVLSLCPTYRTIAPPVAAAPYPVGAAVAGHAAGPA